MRLRDGATDDRGGESLRNVRGGFGPSWSRVAYACGVVGAQPDWLCHKVRGRQKGLCHRASPYILAELRVVVAVEIVAEPLGLIGVEGAIDHGFEDGFEEAGVFG